MKYIYVVVIALFINFSANGQTEQVEVGSRILVILKNDNEVSGRVISSDLESITLLNDIGEIKVIRANIKKLKVGETEEKLNESIYRNFDDSYLLLPSARPVGKGNSHYKNYNIFYNQFNFGLTDNFSLGAGFESFSFFEGDFSQVFFLAPKFSVGEGMNHFGIGTSAFFISEGGLGGLAFLNYTYGTAAKNITLGASFAYSGKGDGNPAIFNINIMYPISKKLSFISEVIFGDFDGVLFDLGLRFKTKSGIAFDAGIIRPSGIGSEVIGLPLLGITLPFK